MEQLVNFVSAATKLGDHDCWSVEQLLLLQIKFLFRHFSNFLNVFHNLLKFLLQHSTDLNLTFVLSIFYSLLLSICLEEIVCCRQIFGIYAPIDCFWTYRLLDIGIDINWRKHTWILYLFPQQILKFLLSLQLIIFLVFSLFFVWGLTNQFVITGIPYVLFRQTVTRVATPLILLLFLVLVIQSIFGDGFKSFECLLNFLVSYFECSGLNGDDIVS